MTGLAGDVLRFGPPAVLAFTIAWLAIATRATSVRLGHPAFGFRRSPRQRLARGLFSGSIALGLAALAADAARLSWDFTVPLTGDGWRARSLGLAAALGGLVLVIAAQAGMGSRWRVGVPDRAPDALVTTGLFGVSRNPVFLGMLAIAAGLTLAVPSPAMLIAALGFALACEIQVRDEERFLEHMFGPGYIAYRSAVRRWI